MAHLSERELREYAAGGLQLEDERRLAEHLLNCQECGGRLAHLSPDREPEAPTMPARANRPAASQRSFRLPEGAQLGRYLVLKRLSSGGMGVVYAAYDPELDRRVAVKVLRRDIAVLDSEEGRTRLFREAQAMARLSHPNVIAVHDVGRAGPDVFIAMELVEGITVSKWLSNTPRSWREIRDVMSAAGEGLAAAHAAGLIHRDFKPSNVIIGNDGRVRVLDFGLARASGLREETPAPPDGLSSSRSGSEGGESKPVTSTTSTDLSQPGVVMGTPGYMAPEQLVGEPADPRTDQFSFCVVMFEALYGARPFGGDTVETQRASISAGRLAEIPTDRRVPVWLHRLVMRGLSTAPEERFESMRALLDALAADPEQRRRSLLRASAVAAIVLAAGGGLFTVRSARARECAGAAANLGGLWTSPTQEQVKAGLLGSGRPFAPDAWRVVDRTVGEYSTRWTSQASALCEAGRTHAAELQRQCLAERRAEVDALLKLLAEPKGPAVENAARAAHSLTDLRRCADPEALSRGPARPADPAVATQLAGVRDRLARAKALTDSGQFAPALEELGPAQALETAARPQVLYQLARLHERVGKYKESERLAHQAAAAAIAQGSPEVAVQAWTMLVALLPARLGRPAESRHWADYAWATIERVGWTPELEAELRNHLGIVALLSADYPAAEKELERAAELQEGLFAPSDPRLAAPLSNLGIALGRMGRLDESRAVHERALALRLRALGPNHPEVGISENNIGTLSHRLGDFNGALAHYERALAIQLAALGAGHQAVLECQEGIALELVEVGRPDAALKVARSALADAEAKGRGDSSVAGELHYSAGRALAALRRPAEAVVDYQRALAIADRTGRTDNPETAKLFSSLALAHEDLGQAAVALAPAERAVELAMKATGNQVELGRAQFALARALWDSGADRERARAALDRARTALEQARAPGAADLRAVEAWAATRSRRSGRAGGH